MSDPEPRFDANASEAAQVLAELAADKAAVADDSARDLHRLLGHSLGAPSSASVRLDRLRLLIELVAASEGRFITITEYERVRLERASARRDADTHVDAVVGVDAETYVDARSLIRAYGHWLSCVTAAARFWFKGGTSRVAASHAHALEHPTSYRPNEIVSALIECRKDLLLDAPHPDSGASEGLGWPWPSEWEYMEYAALRRRLAGLAGKEVRFPSAKQIRKGFGSFAGAVITAGKLLSTRGTDRLTEAD